MYNTKNLFPQGHAIGNAFCNREEERARLASCFQNNEHTVVVAPRRYGKSSLIKQVMLDTKIAGKRIDLLPATNILFINKAIRTCFSDLASQLAPKTKVAKEKIVDFVKGLHPKLTFNILGQRLEVSTKESPENSVIEYLVGLDVMAKKLGKRAVICFDEFQQVGLLKNHHSIEASIRHAVESSTNITYIFSGSSRHLLSQMFNSKSRPLYHLCELMEIDRISSQTYLPILKKRAETHWKIKIDESVIREILNLTQCHPYYVNALCRQIWRLPKVPKRNDIQTTWYDYVESQHNWISDDLARLTPNQRNILSAITYFSINEPYGSEFSDKVKLSISSIRTALNILLKQDFIYKDKSGYYRVLDPAIETFIKQIHNFDFLDD